MLGTAKGAQIGVLHRSRAPADAARARVTPHLGVLPPARGFLGVLEREEPRRRGTEARPLRGPRVGVIS